MSTKDKDFNNLKEAIQNCNYHPNDDFASLNILVTSNFGNGKTTLKNKVLEEFSTQDELKEKYDVIDIEILTNEDMDLIDNILLAIINKYEEVSAMKDICRNILELISKKWNWLNNTQEFLKCFKDNGKGKITDLFKDKYFIRNKLNELLGEIYKKNGNKKFIFLFDELDRCTEDYIRKFFSKIKVLFNHVYIINIVFSNKNVLDALFNSLNDVDGEKFIDKFFQKVIYLKPEPYIAINEFMNECFDQWKKPLFNKDVPHNLIYGNNDDVFMIDKLKTITYRDFEKNKVFIENFCNNLSSTHSERRLYTRNLTNENWLWQNTWWAKIIVYMICKSSYDYESITSCLKNIESKYEIDIAQ